MCRDFFENEISKGSTEDNLYYAYGIAAALNDDWEHAIPMLKLADSRAYAEKRREHIASLLSSHTKTDVP